MDEMKTCVNVVEDGCYVLANGSLTADLKMRLGNAPSNHCKDIFHLTEVPIPTSFVILPHELKWDTETQQLVAPTKDHIELSEQIGHCLLMMNKVAARLSFWISMKKHFGQRHSREKLKEWKNRSLRENTKSVAKEIVKEIHCGISYVNICREVLENHSGRSNAKSYIEDPIKAAREEFEHCTKTLLKCFASEKYFFYLLDEHSWMPVSSGVNERGASYPIHVSANAHLLIDFFLPFMKISMMAATSVDGLTGMARMLGLPPSQTIPESWKSAKMGLVHRPSHPSSVAKFASLHHLISKEGNDSCSAGGQESGYNCALKDGNQIRSELFLLERFYDEHDPASQFSDLRKVSDGKGRTLWLSAIELQRVMQDAEEVLLRDHLQKINSGINKMNNCGEEMEMMRGRDKKPKSRKNRSESIHSVHTAMSEWSASTISTTKMFHSKRTFSLREKQRCHGKNMASRICSCGRER